MKILKHWAVRTIGLISFAILLVIAGISVSGCQEKVTLRFETNGGTRLESVEGIVGTAYTVPSDPVKEGYFFDGWYLSEDFSGERQELPHAMPDKSTTYYAKYVKYPHLTLNPEGGEIAKSEHLVKPGTNLCEYLKEYAPQKTGLVFGGWFAGDKAIDQDFVMTEEDLSLSARYKASYAVEIYLQDADFPQEFERSEELSETDFGWEGDTLCAKIPQIEHFSLDESRAIVKNRILRPGENLLKFYFLRNPVKLTYISETPEGERSEQIIDSRYGAHITVSDSLLQREGYALYGWAEESGGKAVYFAQDKLTLGADDVLLFSSWAKRYPSARGEGQLLVEESAEHGIHRSLFLSGGARSEGSFNEHDSTFQIADCSGRLDERGYCLLDDSGIYSGYALRKNAVDIDCGTLSLCFLDGSAVYQRDGKEFSGKYEYLFDEDLNRYTGKYQFTQEETTFLFTLSEKDGYFLRRGEETGEYLLEGDEQISGLDRLTLDGFGEAILLSGGAEKRGTYRGNISGGSDWLFEADGESIRFLLVQKEWNVGGRTEQENGFLLFDENLSGAYTGKGSLVLDGYGVNGEYRSGNGETVRGRFVRDGVFITLYGDKTLFFTLQGEKFFPTGKEAGRYEGEKGSIFLDGAGGAALKSKETESEGGYLSLGGEEYQFVPARGATFQFKIEGESYQLFRPELYRTYTGGSGYTLELDGYGSGVFTMFKNSPQRINVGYFDDELIEILSPELSGPMYFRIRSHNTISLADEPEVGRYYLTKAGTPSEEYLVLNGQNKAKLMRGDRLEYGEYSYDASKKEVRFFGESQIEIGYLLTVRDGVLACVQSIRGGTYLNLGTLILNGYDEAQYIKPDGSQIEGVYAETAEGVKLFAGNSLFRFTLTDGEILNVCEYRSYDGPLGTLYLQTDGTSAILKGETETEGVYAEGDAYTFTGSGEFSFKVNQDRYLLYEKSAEMTLPVEGGGSLTTDGCGGGVYLCGEVKISGKITILNSFLELYSEMIGSPSGKLAFERTELGVKALGSEYGEYAGREGETLVLDGKGGGSYRGVWGGYLPEGEGYVFSGGGVHFRFRLASDEGKAIFEVYQEKLAQKSGSYESDRGTVKVTAYEISLRSGGVTKRLNVIYACETFFAAKSETGAVLGFDYKEQKFFEVSKSTRIL